MNLTDLDGHKALLKTLLSDFNFIPETCTEINAGMNNKLFVLTDKEDQKLLLKYYFRDERNRLEREYSAYSYLSEHGLSVPKAYFKNDEYYFAVYSFETGTTKDVSELNSEDIKLMAEFLADLTALSKETAYEEFPESVLSCLSLQDYVNNIQQRLDAFISALDEKDVPEEMVTFNEEYDVKRTIETMIKNAIHNIADQELSKDLAKEKQILCPIDYGPHNALFKNDGSVIFVDFEYFGWDDICRVLGDVLVHDRTFDLSQELKDLFISTYMDKTGLEQELSTRLEIVKELISIEWLTIYLSSITPKKLQSRTFANSDFDSHGYIIQQIAKYKKRIATIQ